MKKNFLLVAAAILSLAACTSEPSVTETSSLPSTIRAGFSDQNDASTKTFASSDESSKKILWTAKDEISLLSGTVNAEYEFQGSTGDASGCFSLTGSSSGELQDGTVYAVYPYSADNSLSGSSISLTFPETQKYTEKSFALGAAPMVASAQKSEDMSFFFRPVCSYLRLNLWNPNGRKARKIVVRTVSGEKISGPATVSGTTLEVQMESAATDSIVLDCGTAGVSLGTTEDAATAFWIALPPLTMAGGFKVTVTDTNGNIFEKSTSSSHTFSRNVVHTMAPVQCQFQNTNPKAISILAIGNSFSVDAMHFLYDILKQAGYTKITLGDLYIGGCSLETHAGNITSDTAAYTYYTTTSGSWNTATSYSAISALKSQDWDYISMQQASGYSGLPDSYDPYLGQIVSIVKANCPNSKLMWHMTWAYQNGSTHSAFPNYDSDQLTMYNAIVSTVKQKILTDSSFDFVIPCGTAIQNVRNSFIGDTVTRDGYHMSYNIGRFVTALMWAKQITGCDLSKITFKPSTYLYTSRQITAIKDAVEKAYQQPLEISESAISKQNPSYQPNTDLQAIVSAAGYDLSSYTEFPFYVTEYAYYNSTANNPSTLTCSETGSTAANLQQFAATDIYTKYDIPAGSLIVLRSGWQYRPEGWTALLTKNASSARPANVTSQIVEVTDSWWGSFSYRAFNIAKQGNPALSADEMSDLKNNFAIFVPKNQ